MSEKQENKKSGKHRLNLDELTPEQLFAKLQKLQNETLKEAGESISGGTGSDSAATIVIGDTFSRSIAGSITPQ
jgi:hypothetical protein